MRLLPGVNLTLSWRRASGLAHLRSVFARRTGVPTTRGGLHRKVGRLLCGLIGRMAGL